MSDNFSTTEHSSLLGNLKNSVIGFLFGIVLFIGSFFVLYWNEGQIDISKIVSKSTTINTETIKAEHNGMFINTYNSINTNNIIGDEQFIKPGKYLSLNRNVERYVWIEKSNSETTNNAGGSSDTKTTYTYDKEWSSIVPNSDNFQVKDGHNNKFEMLGLNNETIYATGTKIGAYNIDLNDVTLPKLSKLNINKENIGATVNKLLEGDYIYVTLNGKSKLDSPEIGDARISYTYIPNDNKKYTVIGKINDDSIIKYREEDGEIFRIFDTDFAGAIAVLHQEYSVMVWLVRAGGFALMWIGLMLITGPLIALARIIPFFGGLVNGLGGIVSFIIALILSGITILVSMILHNVIALVVVLIATVLVIAYILKNKKRKAK